MKTIKFTKSENSYYNGNGAYQKEYEELYKKLVPNSGSAQTIHGELIRAISRLSHEYYNNGNCNAAEIKFVKNEDVYSGYEDSEEEIDEVTIDPFYQKFINLILNQLIEEVHGNVIFEAIEDIEELIKEGPKEHSDYFSQKNIAKYNRLMDYVIWFVLNTEDANLPENYERD